MKQLSTALSFALMLVLSWSAHADDIAQRGMFLCRSPIIAHYYWSDINAAQQLGIQVNKDVAAQIAKKQECVRVVSDDLKVARAGWAGMLAITDGKVTGWAAPEYYAMYVNEPARK
jgi:hypothetical protein